MSDPLHPSAGWSPERFALLDKLFRDGLSAAQMAARIGGITRNAVISKLHRSGLASQKADVRRATSVRATPSAPRRMDRPVVLKLKAPAKPKAPLAIAGNGMVFEKPEGHAPTEIVPERIEAAGSATIFTLSAHTCRWPIGDPSSETFTFCGAKRQRGSYCEGHAKVAYQAQVAPNGKKRSTANELARSLRKYL